MVLADADHVEADLVGQLDLLEQVGDTSLGRQRRAGRGVGRVLDEGVEAQLERRGHQPTVRRSHASERRHSSSPLRSGGQMVCAAWIVPGRRTCSTGTPASARRAA